MSATITVRYDGPRPAAQELQSYDLAVTVTAATGISKKIFVWQRNTGSRTDEESNGYPDKFVSIADPVDLEQYPEDVADPLPNIPYYRTDNVTLRFRSMDELDEVKALIDADIAKLILAVNEADSLETQETKVY